MLLAAVFLAAFAWQRHRSVFRAIEADRDAAVAVATAHRLTVAEAMALRELLGREAPPAAWNDAASSFAARRRQMGDPLAAVAVAGDEEAAAAALRATADPASAWAVFRTDVRAIAGLRFLAMRERFEKRDRPRD